MGRKEIASWYWREIESFALRRGQCRCLIFPLNENVELWVIGLEGLQLVIFNWTSKENWVGGSIALKEIYGEFFEIFA